MKTEFTAVKKGSFTLSMELSFHLFQLGRWVCSYAVKGQDNDKSMGLYPLLVFPAIAFAYLPYLQS